MFRQSVEFCLLEASAKVLVLRGKAYIFAEFEEIDKTSSRGALVRTDFDRRIDDLRKLFIADSAESVCRDAEKIVREVENRLGEAAVYDLL